MSQPDFPPVNPYQPPAPAPVIPAIDPRDAELRAKIKKFRDQIHALGALWIIIGGFALGVGLFVLSSGQHELAEPFLAIFLAVAGAIWLGLGISTCLKQMWAVYVALVLTYVSLLGNIFQFNFCSLVILIAVILQAHRVIGWARELQRLGIPLSTKP